MDVSCGSDSTVEECCWCPVVSVRSRPDPCLRLAVRERAELPAPPLPLGAPAVAGAHGSRCEKLN